MKLKYVLIAFVALILAACGGSADADANDIQHQPQEAAAYSEYGNGYEEPDESAIRLQRWIADVEQFEAHIIRWHPRFAHRAINQRDENLEIRRQFDAGVAALLADLQTTGGGGLTDFEIKVEMQRIIALLRDNHFFFTGFAGYHANMRLVRFPLNFAYFSGENAGVYLIQAREDFAHALNSRVVAIGGVPIDEIFIEFQRFWSVENVYDARYQFATLLNAAIILQAIGVSNGASATYTFENGVEITVSEANIWERNMTNLRWFPSVPLVDARAEGDEPVFRRNFRQNLWHEFLPEYGILFVGIRGWVTDVQGAFARAVQNTFDSNDVQAVIIDARSNPGGDAMQFSELFAHMSRNLPDGRLFYFVNEGSNSGSLGMAFFMENLGAVVVGQPLAQHPDFYWFGSGVSRVLLNYSRIELTPPPTFFSALQFYGREPYDSIFRPHVLIDYTIDDWINNHDPLFDFVVEQMSADNGD